MTDRKSTDHDPSRQMSFDFIGASPLALPKRTKPPVPKRPKRVEIIAPEAPQRTPEPAPVELAKPVVEIEGDRPTLSQLEHAYLHGQRSKYEERLFTAARWFVLSMVAAVATKAGLPLSAVGIDPLFLTPKNAQLVPGILGSAVILSGGTVLYYVIRVRQYAVQGELDFASNRAAGWVARSLLGFGSILMVIAFVTVLYLTRWDILVMSTWIIDHTTNVLNGWEPQVRTY